jgi:hypothetical protein
VWPFFRIPFSFHLDICDYGERILGGRFGDRANCDAAGANDNTTTATDDATSGVIARWSAAN